MRSAVSQRGAAAQWALVLLADEGEALRLALPLQLARPRLHLRFALLGREGESLELQLEVGRVHELALPLGLFIQIFTLRSTFREGSTSCNSDE